MNPDRACDAIAATIKEYVKTRSAYRKATDGQTYSTGMTIVSPDDKRIDEIARLATEAVMRVDDGRARVIVETGKLQLGDVFTRYAVKDGIAVDEEVTVLKAETRGNRTTLRYTRPNNKVESCEIDSTWLVSVVRPTSDDLKKQLAEVGND